MTEFQEEENAEEVEARAEPMASLPLPPIAENIAGEEKLQTPSPPELNGNETSKDLDIEKISDHHQQEKISPEKSSPEKISGGSVDRDLALARVKTVKKASIIRAWEESQKAKFENKAKKKMSSIAAWENSQMAAIEAEIRKMEEAFEKKKAECAEKMKNRMASIHEAAEVKRAKVEARKGEETLKSQDAAAKFRAAGNAPKIVLGCFGAH